MQNIIVIDRVFGEEGFDTGLLVESISCQALQSGLDQCFVESVYPSAIFSSLEIWGESLSYQFPITAGDTKLMGRLACGFGLMHFHWSAAQTMHPVAIVANQITDPAGEPDVASLDCHIAKFCNKISEY